MLHGKSKTLDEFKAKLKENGADFPASFVENLDRLILALHPKYKKKAKANTKSKKKGSGDTTTKDHQARMFPGLALPDQEWKPSPLDGKNESAPDKDATEKEVDGLMSQLEGFVKKSRPRAADMMDIDGPATKRRRTDSSPPRRRSRSPQMDRDGPRDRSRGRDDWDRERRRQQLDERPVLYKIYDGKISGLRDFGAFVTLEGVRGRVEGASPPETSGPESDRILGLVHVSMIQQGSGRVNNPADLLRRNQPVKVKVTQLAGQRVSLSMKDVDQATGRDLTPHLRIKSEAEIEAEREEHSRRVTSGANSAPLGGRGVSGPMDPPVRSAKRLSSPERWEIKQLIASGAVDSSEYPELDEDMFNTSAAAEVEEELDVEIREDEPPFLAGQTKRSLEMSPVKIVKAPDGSLNRAALAGAALQKERKELRQQELNDQADAEARDFSTPWLDPMAQSGDKVFAQDLRGHLLGQKANEQSSWREQTFNKTTTFGKITNLSIEEQRKGLPIYKLREPLVHAIRDVGIPRLALALRYSPVFSRTKYSSLSVIPDLGRQPSSHNTSLKKALRINAVLVAPNPAVSPPCL